jgi:hypothetical protein
MSDFRVHNIIDKIEIPAPQHSPDASYWVCYGQVNWGDGKIREAIFVLMCYGGQPAYQRVAHILITAATDNGLTDLDLVMSAIQRLKAKYNL